MLKKTAKRDPLAGRVTLGAMAALAVVGLSALPATAGSGHLSRFCSTTADLTKAACVNDVQDDYFLAIGVCLNISDSGERRDCNREAWSERIEGFRLCKAQRTARREVCAAIGEERYDPQYGPGDFVDPNRIGQGVAPNPYFPLVPGNEWVYEGDGETITVTVLEKTKLIDGIVCRVVRDVVEEDGQPVEITDDWFAQDLEGNVWYFGEIAQNFELFEGDDPEEAELVDIDGSWKTGREGAKPGIIFHAFPQVGVTYREEVKLGEAEDVAEVLSVSGTESSPAAACDGTCLVTRNFTPIEPGNEETKYYAPGVGLILEVDGDGNRVELIEVSTP